MLSLAACDTVDALDIDGARAEPCDGHEPDIAEGEGHPYLYCHQEPGEEIYDPYHPACVLGCGYIDITDGDGHMVCGIPCDTDAECEIWDPEAASVASCHGKRCYFWCATDEQCPSGLECVEGECYAPYSWSEPEPEPPEQPGPR